MLCQLRSDVETHELGGLGITHLPIQRHCRERDPQDSHTYHSCFAATVLRVTLTQGAVRDSLQRAIHSSN